MFFGTYCDEIVKKEEARIEEDQNRIDVDNEENMEGDSLNKYSKQISSIVDSRSHRIVLNH